MNKLFYVVKWPEKMFQRVELTRILFNSESEVHDFDEDQTFYCHALLFAETIEHDSNSKLSSENSDGVPSSCVVSNRPMSIRSNSASTSCDLKPTTSSNTPTVVANTSTTTSDISNTSLQ